MSDIILNTTQLSAVSAFRDYLVSPKQVFMLKGAAGTGKTTLLKEFIKLLSALKREVVLMAPTGRAAYVLRSKVGRHASTVHRHIYSLTQLKSTSQNKETEDDGGLHAKFSLRVNDDAIDTVYIVDEASMISDNFSENEAFSFGSGKLMSDLFNYVSGRKIVFVGDYAQLPPVGMNTSPALNKEYTEATFDCKVEEFMLREVMRQTDGSMILRNATEIRDHIEAKTFIEFTLREGSDAIAVNSDLLIPYYSLSLEKPDVHSAVITYNNRQSLFYNMAIRKHYFGEDSPRLIAGDILMVARNYYGDGRELFNGNIVKVMACQSDDELECRRITVKLGKDRKETVELRFRKVTIGFNCGDGAESYSLTILDNFLDDPSSSIGALLARALVVDFENRMDSKLKENIKTIRRVIRTGAKLTVEQKEILDSYNKLLLNDHYYNALICKYGYAITCHKAQGGEWNNVFVDMSRFGGTANEDYFRWAYTALTRASKKLWYFQAPEFSYISSLVVESIQLSPNVKISIYTGDGSDFCSQRFDCIKNLCLANSITVSEDRSAAWQHRISFISSDGEAVTFSLWYNKKGYSGKVTLLTASSDDFKNICSQIIEDSLIPTNVPFSAPDRPFAEKLVAFVKSQLKETGIQLLDITKEQYQDVFHLRTDGLAKVIFSYTGKGNYTYMRLISSIGSEDAKLEAFRQRFK